MGGHRDTTFIEGSTGESGQAVVLECRKCGVICERVVYPWRCLKAGEKCTYSFSDGETTYFGCLHKVFSPELDLRAFEALLADRTLRSDPYGAIRVTGSPRAQCPISVERAYCAGVEEHACVNPTFLRDVFKASSSFDGLGIE